MLQLTNLGNEKQVEVKLEGISNVAFYDDGIILFTYDKLLREATLEEVFGEPDLLIFKRVEDVDEVSSYTDTSLLHSRRVLYYTSFDLISYEFNVDTRENKGIQIEQKMWMISSLMRIDCGMKAVFEDRSNMLIYALNWDNMVTPLHEVEEDRHLTSLFASSTYPCDLSKSVFKHQYYLVKGENKVVPEEPISLVIDQSVIRV